MYILINKIVNNKTYIRTKKLCAALFIAKLFFASCNKRSDIHTYGNDEINASDRNKLTSTPFILNDLGGLEVHFERFGVRLYFYKYK